MNNLTKFAFTPLVLLCLTGTTLYTSLVNAATFVGEGTAAGAQCDSRGVNNNGVVTGMCLPGNVSGPAVAWVAVTAGTEVPLPPLVTGQSCDALGIANNGTIAGVCVTADNRATGVFWSATAPSSLPQKLQSLSVLGTGLLPEVATAITAYNQSGVLGGESLSGSNDATAVLWLAGSTAPVQLSILHDNCRVADVNDTPINGLPSSALNCPNTATGNDTAKVIQKTGLLGALVTTVLSTPSGSTGCSLSSVNNAMQMLGTCHFAAPDTPSAAYWASPASTPILLSSVSGVAGTPRIEGLRLNNNGNAVVSYQNTDGHALLAFWAASTTGATKLIPTLAGGTHVGFVDLSDNDTVALTSENTGEHAQAATWTAAAGTVAIPQFNAGEESGLTAISPNGSYVAGIAEDSAHNDDAVVATLP